MLNILRVKRKFHKFDHHGPKVGEPGVDYCFTKVHISDAANIQCEAISSTDFATMTTLISSLNSLTTTTYPTNTASVPTTIPPLNQVQENVDKVLQEKLKHEVNLTQVEATQVKAKELTNNLDNVNKKIDEIYDSISKKREVLRDRSHTT